MQMRYFGYKRATFDALELIPLVVTGRPTRTDVSNTLLRQTMKRRSAILESQPHQPHKTFRKDVTDSLSRADTPGPLKKTDDGQRSSSQFWHDINSWKYSVKIAFDKKKTLKTSADNEFLNLPFARQVFKERVWVVDSLKDLKKALNSEKDRLDNLEITTWHRHTFCMNPARKVLPIVRSQYGVEYGSKAWGKIMELLSTTNVFPELMLETYADGSQQERFKSVHLCEGPGAFIAGIHHYINTHHAGLKWDWMATTLNPYHESNDILCMIEDDTLIRAHPNKWTFLRDNTGDIMNHRNIMGLVQTVGKVFGSVHLVTADGSVDCQDVPGEQENRISDILIAEIIIALHILSEGGTLFIKTFTFFECNTICYLYLLACVFSEVTFLKPAISKEGNSELYVVCSGYSGISAELKARLNFTKLFQKNLKKFALFPRSAIPDAFIQKVDDIARFFVGEQITSISRNISSFGVEGIYSRIYQHQLNLAFNWIERFDIKPLDPDNRLFRASPVPHNNSKSEVGTFMTRDAYANLPFKNIGRTVKKKMADIIDNQRLEGSGFTIDSTYKIERVKLGKKFKNIQSSPFCKARLLILRQQLRDLLIDNWTEDISDRIQHCTDWENKLKLKKADREFLAGQKWTMKTLCYHESIERFIRSTDLKDTISGLFCLVATLETLEKGTSVFLCEYPLLTRIHVGFIFALTGCFERIFIGFNHKDKFQGVLLFGFKGFDGNPDLLDSLQVIIIAMLCKLPNEAVLECIPVHILITSKYSRGLMEYNVANVMRGIQEMADRVDATND